MRGGSSNCRKELAHFKGTWMNGAGKLMIRCRKIESPQWNKLPILSQALQKTKTKNDFSASLYLLINSMGSLLGFTLLKEVV